MHGLLTGMPDPVEVRIALVMNGGVSLAVWMAGVTHELDLLRRASKGLTPPESVDERAVYDTWKRFCTELNVTVTVDVVAGSSAGGINGVLLATGIARGAPLPQLRQTWQETAQLDDDHLLWPMKEENAASVLNGDFFGSKVRKIVEGIRPESAGGGEDVTLFVTATTVGDQSRQVLDSDGVPFTVPDHRCLYRFRRQRRRVYSGNGSAATSDILDLFPPDERPDPFENSNALSHAARASASFPAAFSPVPEKVFSNPGDPPGLDQYRMAGSDGAWLMDGGVLDNAPFEPVLDEIARRPVDNIWRRALVYVVPSVVGNRSGESDSSPPGWQQVALSAVFLPREVDLRNDIDGVKNLLAEAERWGGGQQRLFAELRQAVGPERDAYRAAAAALFTSYRRSRINGGITDVFREWGQSDPQAPIRLTPPTGTEEKTQPAGWAPSSMEDIGDQSTWSWGTAVADRALRLMLRDIAVESNHPGLSPEKRREALTFLSTRLECVTAVRDAMVQRIREVAPATPDAVLAVNAVNQAVDELQVGPVLARLVREGAGAYAAAAGLLEGHPDPSTALSTEDVAGAVTGVITDALTAEVLTGAFTADRAFSRPVPFTFFRFGPDVASPLFAVRDPKNENAVLPFGPWKLWGTQLGHFAAFGRPEWRDHDWLWGRLDGAAHLVRLLVSQASQTVEDPDEVVESVQKSILAGQGRSGWNKANEDLQRMPHLTFRNVLRQWTDNIDGKRSAEETVDSILRTLRNRDHGNNPSVASIGELATILIGDEIPASLRDEWDEDLKRVASRAFRLREKLEHYLLSEDFLQ